MTTANWSYLARDGVLKTVNHAARKVAAQYPHVTTFEDMAQEAMLLVATKRDLQAAITTPDLGLGVMHRRLEMDLRNYLEPASKAYVRQTSFEAFASGWREHEA